MDIYTIGKFLHVAVAIAWLGGGLSLVLLGSLALRDGDGERMLWIARLGETLAQRVFIPSTLVILLLGLILTWLDWSFLDAWIVIGILGVVMTGAIGDMILTPLMRRITSAPAAERDAAARKFVNSAKADLIMLFTIVWAMVSKPAWSDTWELLAMVGIIALGAGIFLRR